MVDSLSYKCWAKKKEIDKQFFWLPLTQHLIDTAEVIALLWEHWLGEGQKDLIKKSMNDSSEDLAKRTAIFLGAIHDLGKATPVFQKKKAFNYSRDLDVQLMDKLEESGLYGLRDKVITEDKDVNHSLAGQVLLYEFGVNEGIASIVGAHHGKPQDDMNMIKLDSFREHFRQSNSKSDPSYFRWHQIQNEIIQWALQKSGFSSVDELPEINQTGQVLLSGLLIMGDWIASNEHYFPLIPISDNEVADSQNRTQEGFDKWGKASLWGGHVLPDFYNRFEVSPRNIQEQFISIVDSIEEPGLIILEAPMGIGKTEAALLASEQLAFRCKKNGIFFGLPTQATSNGIFPRVKKWLGKIEVEPGSKNSLRLVHGKAHLNEQFQSIARNIDIEDPQGTVFVNSWFNGRKSALLDDFVVGTVDQFLMVALKQKHLALRHLGFSKKVVIIDEVHAYDAYSSQYLKKALAWMGAYGVPVILLSATLSKSARFEFMINYLTGKGQEEDILYEMLAPLSLELEKMQDYPLITYTDGLEFKMVGNLPINFHKEVRILPIDDNEIITIIKHKFGSEGGICGIIVNTVFRAQNLAKHLAEEFGVDNIEVFHSSFIAEHRIQKEQNLMQSIGKDGNRPKFKIIIGTQVLEQSLDIDFDLLISDLAPMDLLIQRIGRLQRHHDISRPKSLNEAICYILGTEKHYDFEPGSVAIYGEYLLAQTQHYLPERLLLPDDISILVQKVYDNDNMSQSLKGFYDKHTQKMRQKKDKAENYQLAYPDTEKKSLIAWLKRSKSDGKDSYDSETGGDASVRDAQDSIEVILLQKVGNGYGFIGTQEDISQMIDLDKVAKKIANQTIRLPYVFSKPHNIDETISLLEKETIVHFDHWKDSPWLKGELGLLLDNEGKVTVGLYTLQYDEDLGLLYERT